MKKKASSRDKRKMSIRKRIQGTSQRPRLCVFRSLNHIYAQVIDDGRGHTLAACSSVDPSVKPLLVGLKKTEHAKLIGVQIAKKCLNQGIHEVVFDRGGFIYHGRVSSLADGAREGGLRF